MKKLLLSMLCLTMTAHILTNSDEMVRKLRLKIKQLKMQVKDLEHSLENAHMKGLSKEEKDNKTKQKNIDKTKIKDLQNQITQILNQKKNSEELRSQTLES